MHILRIVYALLIVQNDDILQMKQYAIDNLSRMSDKLSMLK